MPYALIVQIPTKIVVGVAASSHPSNINELSQICFAARHCGSTLYWDIVLERVILFFKKCNYPHLSGEGCWILCQPMSATCPPPASPPPQLPALDPNGKLPMAMFPPGLQHTSIASSQWQSSHLDPSSRRQSRISTTNSDGSVTMDLNWFQPRTPDGSVPHQSDGRSEHMLDNVR